MGKVDTTKVTKYKAQAYEWAEDRKPTKGHAKAIKKSERQAGRKEVTNSCSFCDGDCRRHLPPEER